MAERLGVDHQGLRQFITSSTWDYERVRATVANWAVDTIAPDAYVVDDMLDQMLAPPTSESTDGSAGGGACRHGQ